MIKSLAFTRMSSVFSRSFLAFGLIVVLRPTRANATQFEREKDSSILSMLGLSLRGSQKGIDASVESTNQEQNIILCLRQPIMTMATSIAPIVK
jgi:hypothetical protein